MMLNRYRELPIRLRRALWIWPAIGLAAVPLPASLGEALGVGAQLGFWWLLLPGLALAPCLSKPGSLGLKKILPVRRKHVGVQARRRASGRLRRALAA